MGAPLLDCNIDTSELQALCGTLEKEYKSAAVQTVNRAALKTQTLLVRMVSQRLVIRPAKLVKNRCRILKARLGVPDAILRITTTPGISVARMTGTRDVRRKGGGVRAPGGRFFAGAFLEKGIGGKLRGLARLAASRLPLAGINVEIEEAVTSNLETATKAGETYMRVEIDRRLQRAADGRRAAAAPAAPASDSGSGEGL